MSFFSIIGTTIIIKKTQEHTSQNIIKGFNNALFYKQILLLWKKICALNSYILFEPDT